MLSRSTPSSLHQFKIAFCREIGRYQQTIRFWRFLRWSSDDGSSFSRAITTGRTAHSTEPNGKLSTMIIPLFLLPLHLFLRLRVFGRIWCWQRLFERINGTTTDGACCGNSCFLHQHGTIVSIYDDFTTHSTNRRLSCNPWRDRHLTAFVRVFSFYAFCTPKKYWKEIIWCSKNLCLLVPLLRRLVRRG